MSQADNLLNAMQDEDNTTVGQHAYVLIDSSTGMYYKLYIKNGKLVMERMTDVGSGDILPPTIITSEDHIIIDNERFVTVPRHLKRIAVQNDHNIETVTFDCPRYWDGLDMSNMNVYINYERPDRHIGSYLCESIRVNESESSIIHFDWTISRDVTKVPGQLTFNVCIKNIDESGNEVEHWNSERNEEMYISKGLDSVEVIVQKYPDVVLHLLERMDHVEEAEVAVTGEEILALRGLINAETASRNEAIESEADARIVADDALSVRIEELENRDVGTIDGDLTVSGTVTANKIVGAVYM